MQQKIFQACTTPATFYKMCLESSVELTGKKLAGVHIFTKQEII